MLNSESLKQIRNPGSSTIYYENKDMKIEASLKIDLFFYLIY